MSSNHWKSRTLGILGGGNMGEALTRGILHSQLLPPSRITVHDPLPSRRTIFTELGCQTSENPIDAIHSDVVLLAVKPQSAKTVVADMAKIIRPGALLVSIAAGIKIASLEALLPGTVGVIRVMPNTPLLVGHGVSAIAAGARVDADAMPLAVELFSCAGLAFPVQEDMLDAVTALSGSGPAYFFRFAETLISAARALGLPAQLARALTIGTMRGSAEMLEKFEDPVLLRERVTSPGGTTAAALQVLHERNLAGIVAEALEAARDRSIEMGRGE